jgi:eukaryotic-like serine/threonine-protein kinase
MEKLNCWEFKKCGYEINGAKAKEVGVCPAASEQRLHGQNSGKNAGRACWVVNATLCNGKVQGNFAIKMSTCIKCPFFNQVVHEEGEKFVKMIDLVHILKENKEK